MTIGVLLRRPSALIPIAMSAAALGLIVGYVVTRGTARQADEGLPAHLWQLLMVGQVPVIGYFGLRWASEAPRNGLFIVGVQLVAALAAAAPVFVLGF